MKRHILFSTKKKTKIISLSSAESAHSMVTFVCLCWGFTAQSTQWGHVERGQFT